MPKKNCNFKMPPNKIFHQFKKINNKFDYGIVDVTLDSIQ